MLNKDQRQRLSLLRGMCKTSRKEAIDALEKNYWDTSMASEWLKLVSVEPDASLEEFQKKFEEARSKVHEMPADRYDLQDSKRMPNRAERRAAMKSEKKNAKKKKKVTTFSMEVE